MEFPGIEGSVYTGLWTNWARGAVIGRTLTLERYQGNLLIAFTASFVALVAIRVWHIICVFLFRRYSNPGPRQTLHHQRQVVLRNATASAESGLWAFLALAWAWRGHKPGRGEAGVITGVLPLAGVALITWVAFTVAGGFSSSIASVSGDVVLLKSVDGRCGYIGSPQTYSETALYVAELATAGNNAANYAQQCYSSKSPGILGCQRFMQSKIPFTTDTAATCPFPDETVCRSKDRNIRLDTGPIDVNGVLGLNTPPDERATVRSVLHCAPLVTEPFVSEQQSENVTMVRYDYGPHIKTVSAGQDPSPIDTYNYTFNEPSVDSQYQRYYYPGLLRSGGSNFRISGVEAPTQYGKPIIAPGYFVPREGIRRSDSDVVIFTLSGNGVTFDQPWTDDWYRATKPGRPFSTGRVTYTTSEAASPLGCIDQVQVCYANQCGPMASINDALIQAAPLFNATAGAASPTSPPASEGPGAALLWWISTAMTVSTWAEVVITLGAKSLSSQSLLRDGVQLKLPSGGIQWHQDVTYWFQTHLASLQASVTTVPLGPVNEDVYTLRKSLPQSEQVFKDLCNRQMVKSTGYTSFNFFGLVFTYAVGCVFIIVSYSLEAVLASLYKRYGFQGYQQVEWTATTPLQLHRMAQEEAGYGEWSQCDDSVPVNSQAEGPLADLVMRDPHHPILNRQQSKVMGSGCRCEADKGKDARISVREEPVSPLSVPTGDPRSFPSRDLPVTRDTIQHGERQNMPDVTISERNG